MTPTQISVWTQTELHNITTLVARLKREDLVSTKRSDIDKRSIDVCLTDKGRMILEQTMPIAQEVIDNIMLSINTTKALKLSKMLEVIRDNTVCIQQQWANLGL